MILLIDLYLNLKEDILYEKFMQYITKKGTNQ